jgi:hypothetical protein
MELRLERQITARGRGAVTKFKRVEHKNKNYSAFKEGTSLN